MFLFFYDSTSSQGFPACTCSSIWRALIIVEQDVKEEEDESRRCGEGKDQVQEGKKEDMTGSRDEVWRRTKRHSAPPINLQELWLSLQL